MQVQGVDELRNFANGLLPGETDGSGTRAVGLGDTSCQRVRRLPDALVSVTGAAPGPYSVCERMVTNVASQLHPGAH